MRMIPVAHRSIHNTDTLCKDHTRSHSQRGLFRRPHRQCHATGLLAITQRLPTAILGLSHLQDQYRWAKQKTHRITFPLRTGRRPIPRSNEELRARCRNYRQPVALSCRWEQKTNRVELLSSPSQCHISQCRLKCSRNGQPPSNKHSLRALLALQHRLGIPSSPARRI